MTDTATADPHTLLAALARKSVRLELSTFDLCCLAALHLRSEREGLTSVPDDLLIDLFEQVCDFVDAGAEQPRKRATHAIQRLLEQRLLLRVDAAGIASAGEYALASLATHIAKAFLDDALTHESLTLLTGTLLSQLAEVKGAAARAQGPHEWAERVTGPLRVTVLDLVGGIDRRQRGLDAEQDQVRSQIAGLLQQGWFDAVDQAQVLLETTTARLAELNTVLLRDAHQLVALLQEIQDLATDHADAAATVEAAQRVIDQVERIAFDERGTPARLVGARALRPRLRARRDPPRRAPPGPASPRRPS